MANDDLDDDIDLGEDFDFEDDIPEEDVDYDDAGPAASSSGGSGKSMVKNLFLTVFGVGFLAVLGGGGYYGYNRYLNKDSLSSGTTVANLDNKKKTNTSKAQTKSAFGDDVSTLVADTDSLFNTYKPSTSSASKTNTAVDLGGLSDQKADPKALANLTKEINSISAEKGKELDDNISDIKDSLNTLAVELSTNINHVQGLENIVKDMSRVVISLNKTVNAMDKRVLSLNSTVETINTDFSDLKGDITTVQRSIAKVNKFVREEDYDLTRGNDSYDESKIMYQAPEYVVHAIIPGRAWLKSTSGKIVTVTEGQSLGNYGNIAVIDTENGTVVTSSGASFR